jgi:hypothetical protein
MMNLGPDKLTTRKLSTKKLRGNKGIIRNNLEGITPLRKHHKHN